MQDIDANAPTRRSQVFVTHGYGATEALLGAVDVDDDRLPVVLP